MQHLVRVEGVEPLAPDSQLEEYAYLSLNRWQFSELIETGGRIRFAGYGRALRTKRVIENDPHAAPAPDRAGWVTVVRRNADQEHSAYVLDVPPHRRPPSVLLEARGFKLWALPNDSDLSLDQWLDQWMGTENWTNLITFWFSRISQGATELFDALARDVGTAYLTVDRQSAPHAADPIPSQGLEWYVRITGPNELAVTVDSTAEDALSGTSNDAERQFVVAVLRAIAGLLNERVDDGKLVQLVEETMKDQRNLRFIRHSDIALVPSGAPYRIVSDWNETEARQSLGHALRKDRLSPDPDVPLTTGFLNGVVERAFSHIENLLKSLHPEGAIEWLVGLNEELVHRSRSLTMQGYMEAAVASSPDRYSGRRIQEMSDVMRASVASRFLVELASATTLQGSRPISLSVYDELLAYSSLIVRLGALSDVIREGLDEARAVVMEDGTLIDAAFNYYRGMDDFGRAAWADDISEEPMELSSRGQPGGRGGQDGPGVLEEGFL